MHTRSLPRDPDWQKCKGRHIPFACRAGFSDRSLCMRRVWSTSFNLTCSEDAGTDRDCPHTRQNEFVDSGRLSDVILFVRGSLYSGSIADELKLVLLSLSSPSHPHDGSSDWFQLLLSISSILSNSFPLFLLDPHFVFSILSGPQIHLIETKLVATSVGLSRMQVKCPTMLGTC